MTNNIILSDMLFYRYKQGYILKPKNIGNTKFKNMKYLMGGFWNTKCNGWFFRKCLKNMLTKKGAKLVSKSNKNPNLTLKIEEKINSI